MSCRTMPLIALSLILLTAATVRAADVDHLVWARRAFAKQSASVPFSFTYAGASSREFLSDWTASIEEDTSQPNTIVRTLTLIDPKTRLEVRAVVKIYTDTPAVDWTLYFTNRGDKPVPVLENVHALDVAVALDSKQAGVLHRLRGSTAGVTDWLPFDDALPVGKRIDFAPVDGRSSMGASPFFNVRAGDGGVITAIGWTGQWRAAIERNDAHVRISAGMQNLHLALEPGETIRSPRIVQLYWQGDDTDRAYNLFRRFMFAHVVPKTGGKTVVPPIAQLSTAFYETDGGTEQIVLDHLHSLRGLGFEYFWLDAYYGRDNFPTVGNYVFPLMRTFNTNRFPRGVKPIGEAAHRDGLKFLLWFEPERICPGTLMTKEHPEWVVLPPEGPWGMLNLAIPEAREQMTRYLNESIREYRINCLRIDNAVPYGRLWRQLDADPDRVGISEIRYAQGLYRALDDILAANPELFIDNCASGGQRIDLEMCARSIPLWRTDATIHPLLVKDYAQAAIQNQAISAGLNRYVPLSTSGQMGTSPYCFRSGFNGGIAFCEDCRPKDFPREELKAAIAEGKRIRKYFLGDFYCLSAVDVDPRHWCVMQYDRRDRGDGMILAFRRGQSPYAAFQCALKGVDPEAEYEVSVSRGYKPEPATRIKGADLAKLIVTVDNRPGSVLVEYRKK